MTKQNKRLIVQKFGGSSVASPARLRRVAKIIAETKGPCSLVAVVVSAMGEETNRLLALAGELDIPADAPERDVLLATGEQVSATLLVACLNAQGLNARVFCAHQIGFLTTSEHGEAKFSRLLSPTLSEALEVGVIPVITGFQGVDQSGHITTLGRGGSDLTAVAIASALNADECQIYTDVDGVYTADPRVVPAAQRIDEIACSTMIDYALAGAGVLQDRCLNMAEREGVRIRVLSSYLPGEGTRIHPMQTPGSEAAKIKGVACTPGYTLISLSNLTQRPGLLSYLLSVFAPKALPISMLSHVMTGAGLSTVQLAVTSDLVPVVRGAFEVLQAGEFPQSSFIEMPCLAKLTLPGVGLDRGAGLLMAASGALSSEGVDPVATCCSSTQIEFLIDESQSKRLVRVLHDLFCLRGSPQVS